MRRTNMPTLGTARRTRTVPVVALVAATVVPAAATTRGIYHVDAARVGDPLFLGTITGPYGTERGPRLDRASPLRVTESSPAVDAFEPHH